MKRRYLAMVLGLVLAIAPANVFAEETAGVVTEDAAESAEETGDAGNAAVSSDEVMTIEETGDAGSAAVSSDEIIAIEEMEENAEMADVQELREQFWGNVTAVDETGITIAVGTLGGDEMPGADLTGGEVPEIPAGEAADGENENVTEDSNITGEFDEGNTEDAEAVSEENAEDAEVIPEENAEDTEVIPEENAEDAAADAEENAEDAEQADAESAYDALELTGEEMTLAITEDTEVYFVYGDTDIVGLKMTARDFAGENGELLLEMQLEDAGEMNVSEEVPEEGAEVTDAEANASEEVPEEGAEATDAEVNAAEGLELSAGEMNKMHTLELERASVESIIPEDLVNITLDEDGNAAVILIVMPQDEA